ncbi:ABC transporter substrate-binding protein [Aquicella lusitana]|uniref:ABC-type uncharacterized transport system substrate-binding protein n=1 Tax=Aquicella lusitana TaxID=254246 RepID=A0A370GMK8_9COXI|nr:ABC transporter substrate binding protein [Aquicella lusitana]RDI44610.1 ABC-type uncharacterized transport system substrate-binding protein [Aquicella lusitana]VVC72448.1 hypothetical protein AQULUS_01600 [Aquicella lusitana]
MKILTRTIELLLLSAMLACLLISLAGCGSSSHEKKVGIVVPLENKALDEIVAGFTETLRKTSSVPVKFKIANAQGDMNVQRAIIQQMRDEKYDIIAPIGTVATQMSAALIQQQPIISLAANFSQQDRLQRKTCNIAVVHDEISPRQTIAFIHEVYPQLTQLTLVHSASDKIFPEVKAAVEAGKEMGINIQPVMVPTLNELYSVANALPQNTQGILVLKDILIASGISTLEIAAQKHHIPLITADQGSVQDGAAFALGVHEREIGVEGAKLAAAVLSGQPVCSLPIVDMKRLTVFMNTAALAKENQSPAAIQAAAKKLNYKIEME